MKSDFRRGAGLTALAALFFALHDHAHAYVGPGAGMAVAGSFFTLFLATLLALLAFLTWPIRWVILKIRRSRAHHSSRVRRVVVLGLDGQDPELTQRYMDEGVMPNFSKLAEKGCFTPLQTTLMAESPVAWSSFQTGCNPGKHKIFDFLVPNRKLYLPELSSAQVTSSGRTLKLGRYHFTFGKPKIDEGRRSKPFWKILGEHGVFSTILRVPISFPPDKFFGTLLSAMCVPDLRGSQGTYDYFTTEENDGLNLSSGVRHQVTVAGGVVRGALEGPDNPIRPDKGVMTAPFELKIDKAKNGAWLTFGREKRFLEVGKYSDWLSVDFKAMPGVTATGITRFYIISIEPHFKLYVMPVNINPEKPILPVSHPFTYSVYLARTQGIFATLGLAEDTSALNEGVISEDAFLEQVWSVHEERKRMYFDALEKTREGVVVCVFDITDRLQHMFFRFLEKDHPANPLTNGTNSTGGKDYADVIRQLYIEADNLLGETMAKIGDDEDSVLFVMSDHGFKSFRRGVNMNTWLVEKGYMKLKETRTGEDMFRDVDWSGTRAYTLGFGGIYLNMKGRERDGIVEPGEEAEKLKAEIIAGLEAVRDNGEVAIKRVYDTKQVYSGPYVKEAPDLIAGFRPGWRAAWSAVTGGVSDEIFEDNTRCWSGDHNFNPADVPGILLCNRRIASDKPRITDMAPTILDLFGIPVPAWCDGESFMPREAGSKPESGGATDVTETASADEEEHAAV